MRPNRFLLLVVTVVALLGVVGVGTAAAVEVEWQIAGEGMKDLGLTEESVTASSSGGPLEIKSKVLGSSFRLKCEQLGASGKLRQEGKGEISLEPSKCSVPEPAGCKTAEKLTGKTSSQAVETGEVLYEKFAPASGETLITIELTGCAAAGSYPLKGSICEETEEAEEELVEQPFTFSEAISKAAGCGILKLGKEAATVSGEAVQKFKLQGANIGEQFRPARPVLCKLLPNANGACAGGQGYRGEVKGALAAGNEVKLENPEGTISCNESSFRGTYNKWSGMGVLNGVTYKDAAGVGGTCVTTRAGEPEVAITFPTIPVNTSRYEFSPGVGHVGFLWWANLAAQIPMKIAFTVETCSYRLSVSSGLFVNGVGAGPSTVAIAVTWQPFAAEKGNLAACPINLVQPNALFNLATGAGGNVYMTRP
jgi:hypothetical protein